MSFVVNGMNMLSRLFGTILKTMESKIAALYWLAIVVLVLDECNLHGKFDRVSLGLLPSSEGGWRYAVRALSDCGGWLHVHGNVPVAEMHSWACGFARGYKSLQ